MKIALINPPNYLRNHERFVVPDSWFPLGLGYLAAYLLRGGHEARIYDPGAKGSTYGELWAELSDFKPDAVGITATTLHIMPARHIAQEAKRRLNCIVILGGPHASAIPKSTLLATTGLDAVICGEGEIPVLAMANEFDARGKVDFSNIPGAAFMREGNFIQNPRPELIADLDTLPYPAREIVDMIPYERASSTYGNGKMATLISSRGCPSQCNFCANPVSMGRKFRPRRAIKVVEEMEYLVTKYGIKHFYIVDDCFTIDPKRAEEICDLIISSKLRVTWQAAVRVNTLQDETLISKMKRSGCVNVLLGIESGDKRVLEKMEKGTTLKMAEDCCEKLHRHKISCYNSYIIGAEGETWSSLIATLIFAKKLASLYAVFNILVPFPGTPLFEKYYKDYDRPDTDWTDWGAVFYRRPYPSRHNHLSWLAQKIWMLTASLLYYMDPFQLLRMVIQGDWPNIRETQKT